MALQVDKRSILTAEINGQHYGPWEFETWSGGEQTMSSAKTRKAAGQVKRARNGSEDVSDVTIGREDDGEIDLKWLWSIRRGRFTIATTPADDDGNPRARDTATYTGKLTSIKRGEGDVNDEGETIDRFELMFSCDSVVS